MEYWTTEGLSMVASGVGKPLYQEAVTRNCSRLDYARVCIMLDYNSTLPKHVIAIQSNRNGKTEVPCKIDVEYEWILPKCVNCKSLGHSSKVCPATSSVPIAPVKIFVPKLRSTVAKVVDSTRPVGVEMAQLSPHQKGKAPLFVENNHSTLHHEYSHEAESSAAGEGRTAPQAGHNDLVEILSLHTTCLISVIYGANEMVSRSELWVRISHHSVAAGETPLMLFGDFNKVLNSSESMGTSVDLTQASDDFQQCLFEAGLATLPMIGAPFSWHNRSEGPRSLWKRLDRVLVNESWLVKWSSQFYHCSTLRTSNHSPLILCHSTGTGYGKAACEVDMVE
ncbi:UNVERIFIED_CONTAM: hypothetical protein Sradi_4398200 [Sesamum radiatum]|uniref:Uncharacterized protein n=1 Tax=Sesamum radiatum TaxID=300843 RepID=A0AAW2NSW2_SESRA